MTKYCSEAGCGGKNEYTTIVPKFCSKCGTPFDKAFKAKARETEPTVQRIIRPAIKQVAYVEEEVLPDLPIPKASDVGVSFASRMTIGDLANVSSPLRDGPSTNLPADIQFSSKTEFKIQDLE